MAEIEHRRRRRGRTSTRSTTTHAGQLVDAWAAAADVDSKFEQFVAEAREVIENGTAKDGKVLVFSFFRKTIEHLAAEPPDTRGRRPAASRQHSLRPDAERGTASDHDARSAKSPGRTSSSRRRSPPRASTSSSRTSMVNYDLPWNPMRVEQRIGRLDRYGQEADVIHIVNFSVEDTIEERILERLYKRIGIFEAAIGDLESILGERDRAADARAAAPRPHAGRGGGRSSRSAPRTSSAREARPSGSRRSRKRSSARTTSSPSSSAARAR